MITRIIGVRHSIPEDTVAGLRLILEAGYDLADKLARILQIQLVGQKAIVLCSPRLEAYMTALIIAMACDELTIVVHPDLLDPLSCKPRHETIKFIIDEAERHEATAIVIVHHGGCEVEEICPDVADELGHQVGFRWEEDYLERELDYAEAVVLDLETDGIKVSYLNSPE